MARIFPPAGDEYSPFYAAYIEEVRDRDPFALLEAQPDEIAALVRGADERDGLAPYAPGKWSVKEVLVHLIDSERIFAARALRFARGDETPVPGFDENAYAPASRADRRPIAGIVEELRAVRAATLTLFRSFDAEDFPRRGTVEGQAVSVRALLWIIAGHMAHHIDVLRDRYGLG